MANMAMNKTNTFMPSSLPLNQIAFSVMDLRLTERWWREGLGFLPAGGNRMIFRGPLTERIVDLPGAAMSCWCMVGRNDWCQLEMFQYEQPMARLMPPDFAPNATGYTRCGVWVADFDLALAQLSALGMQTQQNHWPLYCCHMIEERPSIQTGEVAIRPDYKRCLPLIIQ